MKSFLKGIKPEFVKEFEKMRPENCDVYFPQFIQKQAFTKAWLNCIFLMWKVRAIKTDLRYIYLKTIKICFLPLHINAN